MHLNFMLSTVCIGFNEPSYTVCESTDPILVCATLQSGELGRDVTVTMQTQDAEAVGTYTMKCLAFPCPSIV